MCAQGVLVLRCVLIKVVELILHLIEHGLGAGEVLMRLAAQSFGADEAGAEHVPQLRHTKPVVRLLLTQQAAMQALQHAISALYAGGNIRQYHLTQTLQDHLLREQRLG